MSIYLYILFPIIIINSLLVIVSKNSVVSILYLVSVFIFVSILLLLLGAEFISVIIIIIYIGAISILFLFIIMMLNLRIVEVYNSLLIYFPIACLLGIFFIIEFIILLYFDNNIFFYFYEYNNKFNINNINYFLLFSKNNLYLLGDILFNFFNHYIVLIGFILLIAMIGCINLTIDLNYHEIVDKKIEMLENIKVRKTRITFWSIKKKYKNKLK